MNINYKEIHFQASINELNRMIKLIKEDRKNDYNGTATTGSFNLRINPKDKNLLNLSFKYL